MAKEKTDETKSFEQGLETLETIVEEMESGDLPLDQLIKQYEEGSKLLRFCQKKIKDAERKIEILKAKHSTEPEFEDFDPDAAKKD